MMTSLILIHKTHQEQTHDYVHLIFHRDNYPYGKYHSKMVNFTLHGKYAFNVLIK